MSSENQGRQSPPPEEQSGAQQSSVPGSGKGVDDKTSNKETSKQDLENLESNPTHILDKHVEAKFGKTVENTKS